MKARKTFFTLIEAIVAMAILGMVLGMLFLGTNTVISAWQTVAENNQILQDNMMLDRTLDNILSNIVPFTWPDEELRESHVFSGLPDELICSYIHEMNRLEDGALRFCGFYLEDGQFVVYYSDRPPPFPDDLASPWLHRTVLSEGVESIAFSYVDKESDTLEFVDDWEDRDFVPLGIMLTVTWTDGSQRSWFRRSAGSGWYERWGRWQRRFKP